MTKNDEAQVVSDIVREDLLAKVIDVAQGRVSAGSNADLRAMALYQSQLSKARTPKDRESIQRRIDRLTENLQFEAEEAAQAEAVSLIKTIVLTILKAAL